MHYYIYINNSTVSTIVNQSTTINNNNETIQQQDTVHVSVEHIQIYYIFDVTFLQQP